MTLYSNFAYNLILDSDSYKSSHFLQYPPNTQEIYSYIESRGGVFSETVFFGLQFFLKKYLVHPIRQEHIDEAQEFFRLHGMTFHQAGWQYILKRHGGYLPIEIKAVAEGTVLPTYNVMTTVHNTDPECFWLTSYLETMILRSIWYGTTVATLSYHAKKIIYEALTKSADNPQSEIAFKLHDFGARGVSSYESAELGGAAHLVNFMGSDTLPGIRCANQYYHSSMSGFSIPAAEHSTITSWGKEYEVDAYANMLKQFAKPGCLLAVVSDSYDLFHAIQNLWGKTLKEKVIQSGATVVIRPDSGDPVSIVSQCLKLLEESYGSTENTKGFKVLNHVRLIQGDGVNLESIQNILNAILQDGFSATNVAFGMGGALLQKVDRDTQKFAMKCSYAKINGHDVEVFKQPKTDLGKQSKKGKLSLICQNKKWQTISQQECLQKNYNDELRTVYREGKILIDEHLDTIRARAII